jgi:hypothetical protein
LNDNSGGKNEISAQNNRHRHTNRRHRLALNQTLRRHSKAGTTFATRAATSLDPGCIASVPKSWGTFRGASTQSGLAFEDASGTIRFLTNIPCQGVPSVSLQITRTAVTTQ